MSVKVLSHHHHQSLLFKLNGPVRTAGLALVMFKMIDHSTESPFFCSRPQKQVQLPTEICGTTPSLPFLKGVCVLIAKIWAVELYWGDATPPNPTQP